MAKKPQKLEPSIGKKLLPREARFVAEYLKDFDATAAYVRAGYHASRNASKSAHEMLKRPHVAAAVSAKNVEVLEVAGVNVTEALRQAWDVATADHRELIELYVVNCRHCWGRDFKYQWNEAEVDAATRDFEQGKLKKAPDFTGGMGFNPRREPCADCPTCGGLGIYRVILKDTRTFGPKAVALYAGVKVTKDGTQVLAHSKMDALEKVFKHLGLYLKDNEQKKSELSEQLRELVGELHQSQAGRAPLALVRDNTRKSA
jgi:phage terminase small subunit